MACSCQSDTDTSGRIECQPVVSIQRIAAGDAVMRHLSWGVLVDDDAVIVPGP